MRQITLEIDDDIYEILNWKASEKSFGDIENFCVWLLKAEANRLASKFITAMELLELREKAKFADLVKTAPQEDIDLLLSKTTKIKEPITM